MHLRRPLQENVVISNPFLCVSLRESIAMDLMIPLLAENDEEILIFDYILNTSHREYHYLKKKEGVFRLEELDDNYCFTHFRFYKNDIRRLRVLLDIPDNVVLENRVKVSGDEALCILLKRLSYPNRHEKSCLAIALKFTNLVLINRYADLMQFFPRGRSALSGICNAMVRHILRVKVDVLEDLNKPWLSRDNLKLYCQSLYDKGSPYERCFGFLDGTVKAICRPIRNQRQV